MDSPIVTPAFCHLMARYNQWQNRGQIDAASTLSVEALVADRGAFFRSILGTLNHLLWGDVVWMSRFDDWEKPTIGIPQSTEFTNDFIAFRGARLAADRAIVDWSGRVTANDLSGELRWFSGALGQDVAKPMAICVAHFFNHQTHHRGQIHAMLTAAGAVPEATDLFILPEQS
ncbi:MAG: DinB family protein [Pseudomonadota bacterium]